MIGSPRTPRVDPGQRQLLSWPAQAALVAGFVAIPALLVYMRTLMPDVGFWDTAEFQAIGPVLGIAHPTGYPTYTLLAWLASVVLQPLGNEAVRANLLSAIFVALACAVVAITVAYLTRRLVVAVGVGIGFAVATEVWKVGLHADPHALHVLLAALILLLLAVWSDRLRRGLDADRWLIAAAGTFGISLANHGLTVLLAPGIALFVLVAYPAILRRPRLIALCVAALTLTTVALYAYLPLRSAMNPPMDYANPQTWEGFSYLVFAEQFRGEFQALPGLVGALRLIVNQSFSQLGLLAILAPFGAVLSVMRRPAIVLLLLAWFATTWLFALGYVNADISRYYLVPLLTVAVLGGIGAAELLNAAAAMLGQDPVSRTPMRRTVLVWLVALVLVAPPLASVPAHFNTVDESADHAARTWLDVVDRALPANSVVVSWWSYSTTLWYAQYVEHWRPDITVIDDRTLIDQHLGDVEDVLDTYLGTRPLFLMRLPWDLARYDSEYELTVVPDIPMGDLYAVKGRKPAAAATNL